MDRSDPQEKNKLPIEITKYFRDFLETNFHRRKAPKRSFKTKTNKNLLCGINLKQFEGVHKLILKGLNSSFVDPIVIQKGKYSEGLNASIIEIVEKYCKNLNTGAYDQAVRSINSLTKSVLESSEKNLDLKKEKIGKIIISEISSKYFAPLLELVAGPLTDVHDYDDEMIASINEELQEIIEENVRQMSSLYVVTNIVEKQVSDLYFSEMLTLDYLISEIKIYFNSLKVEDLFFKINELVNNEEIIDKQELYLYLFDIKLEDSVYPLFYVRLNASKDKNKITLVPDSVAYINKKAVDFVAETINRKSDKQGKIKSAENRIVYFKDQNAKLSEAIESLANELLNFSEINGLFDLASNGFQAFRSESVRFSNNCYFALFDKSDESLVNDYEELLLMFSGAGNILSEKFAGLINEFLTLDPQKITMLIEREWGDTEVSEKLVNVSPIPMNEEQNQIISAINKSNCKFIAVEGPPGTGKSHTITAIAFNAILKNQSVLILSDKDEALEVVENKISETLDKVRVGEDFLNPILRLGKAGTTYNKILSNESLSNIKSHHQVYSRKRDAVKSEVSNLSGNLKSSIKSEIDEYKKVKINDLIRIEKIESQLQKRNLYQLAMTALLYDETEFLEDLESIFQIFQDVYPMINSESLAMEVFAIACGKDFRYLPLHCFCSLVDVIQSVQAIGSNSFIGRVGGINPSNIGKFKSVVLRLNDMGRGLFGYFFKSKQLKELMSEFQSDFPSPEIINFLDIRADLNECIKIIDKFENELAGKNLSHRNFKCNLYDILPRMLRIDLDKWKSDIETLRDDASEVISFVETYPEVAKELKFTNEQEILESELKKIGDDDFSLLCEYLHLNIRVGQAFRGVPGDDFVSQKNAIEKFHIVQMTDILDDRVINFSEKYSAKAKTLKSIISSKKQFPKEEFAVMKEAFPCIIAGIRDFADYIPLEPEIFDLVIIDEASQVSIAQALPALLRAKKIIVFGDKRQFSNIKSAQAKSEVNQLYITQIKEAFLKSREVSDGELERLAKFNIKTSVLEFFEYICNYSTMLRKHFRGYRELISYSSKHFYQNHLQSIKIRAKHAHEILEFRVLEHDGKMDLTENTNSIEINEVISILKELVVHSKPPSVGIITPHTNQQKVMSDKIMNHPEYEDFKQKCKLKIMTFDTCQGEERDVIIYSMVATKTSDKLGHIFLSSLKDVDLDEDNKIRAQRLNVGFSRAKEKMIFLLSKPIESFSGSIGEALRHYHLTLEKAKTVPLASDVDPNSPMESKVLEWIQETQFYKEHTERIEIKAQFPMGEYLKQLHPTYDHPKYKVDFLIVYKVSETESLKIVIEYDGFKEHFENLSEVSEYNYAVYQKDDDVYREKVLESYGCRFIRLNKYNSGKDPIKVLDSKFQAIVKSRSEKTNSMINDIERMIEGSQNGSFQECYRCGQLLPREDFLDPRLDSRYGRNCRKCKSKKPPRKKKRVATVRAVEPTIIAPANSNKSEPSSVMTCSSCGGVMEIKSGKFGKFWGCRSFPRCRNTKDISK